MSPRVRKSSFARAMQRAATSMTRSAFKAGAKAAGKAVARTVDAMAAQYRPPPGSGDWIAGQAMGPAGLRRFFLFRPVGVRNDERLPLVVMLHGCGQTAAVFARSTRMNRMATRERFLVLYPEQDVTHNPQGCWNWYDTRNYHADAEAATLMAAIDQACLLYPVDRDAVAVAGLSAGASMAALLAVSYPQRFCAVAMHSGVPPGSAHSAAGALAAMHGRRLPAEVAQDGKRPPLLVIHGRDDAVVSARNGQAAAAQWATALGAAQGESRIVQRGTRKAMTVTDCRRSRRVYVRRCEVDRLSHAWSGGAPGQMFSDDKGPDASSLIWRFVAAQLPKATAAATVRR